MGEEVGTVSVGSVHVIASNVVGLVVGAGVVVVGVVVGIAVLVVDVCDVEGNVDKLDIGFVTICSTGSVTATEEWGI